MTEVAPAQPPSRFVLPHPPGFRARRGLNWVSLGLLYASFYMCRYNFRFAVPGMEREFGFSHADMTNMLANWSLAYGTGQLINGLLCDRIGGKKMAGFAAGVIDSFQYYGAALSRYLTGRILTATQATHGYTYWFAEMAGFGVLGGISMWLVMRKQKRMAAQQAV